MANHYILMGDVVSSSDYKAQSLQKDLKGLVDQVNHIMQLSTLSPYTITLGDEFQGISESALSAMQTIFQFEEACLERQLNFKLRYVLLYGEIDTELNPDIAWEMLGPGLKEARELLSTKSRSRKRFQFNLGDEKRSEQLGRLFMVLDAIIQSWKTEDFPLILDMIRESNNEKVAGKHGKNRDQIWKRRNTLMIEEYNALKTFILNYSGDAA